VWPGIKEGTSRTKDAHTNGVILTGTRRLLPVDNDPHASLTGAYDIPNAGGGPSRKWSAMLDLYKQLAGG